MTARGATHFKARRSPSGERGAVAVEFALILPILVLLLFGIIEFSITYNRTQALHAGAREGARLGSLSSTSSGEIEAKVRDAIDGIKWDPAPTIKITPSGGRPCGDAETVRVVVTYPHTISIPFWGSEDVTLRGKGEFRCE